MHDPQPNPIPGTVITVREPASREFELGLVLSVTDREFDVAAVSEEIELATQRDSILPADIAGFRAAVFVDTHGLVLREQYGETLGRVSIGDGTPGWTGEGFPVGPPVLSDIDPRVAKRSEFTERWAPYWEPVASLRATQTFGELLARHRTLNGATAQDVSTAADIEPATVAALERDDPTVTAGVGPKPLAAVLRRLGVIFGAEAEARLRLMLLITSATAARPSVAYRAHRRNLSAQWPREDADRYVAAVRRHLAE